MLDPKTIAAIKSYFQNQPVLRAYLFGSHLNAEIESNNDIDILVELDYSKRIGLHFIQMQIDLEHILQKKVDLVSSQGISSYILPIVDREKKLIYAK